jgi:hypothetical protein
MPSLLVALSSSYGYLLARDLIRHIMKRAIWEVSPENKQLEASQSEIKTLFLKKMNDQLVDDDANTRKTQLGSDSIGDDVFWTHDEGIEELHQAVKMA